MSVTGLVSKGLAVDSTYVSRGSTRGHRSRLWNLPWRWVETMTSPAVVSDPFRAGSGNGALNGDQPKSDKVEWMGLGGNCS